MALSHKKLQSWYLQMAQSLESGLTIPQSLRASGDAPSLDLETMAQRIESGESIDDLMRDPPKWFPKADRYFISAASTTGRLPQTFKSLSERHATIGANIQKAILGLLYPVAVLNFCILIMPVMRMVNFETGFQADLGGYLGMVIPLMVILWGTIIAVGVLVKYESPIITLIMRAMPIISGYYQFKVLANFAYSLGTFLEAGVGITRSWSGAGLVAGDARLQKVVADMKQLIEQGEPPGEHLSKYSIFPSDFRALYLTGERTGQLDANLIKIGKSYQQKANHRMTFAAIIYPSFLFLCVAGVIVYQVLSMYAGYLEGITNMMN